MLLDLLEFLQFRAFFSKPYQNQGFTWNEVIFIFAGVWGGRGCSHKLLDFFEFFGIPAVLGLFLLKFLFWILLDFQQPRAFLLPYQNHFFGS